MAKSRMTLHLILTGTPDVDLSKIDATTEQDIRRHMRDEGYDPDEAIDDIISPRSSASASACRSARFAEVIRVPVATLQNWEQGRTLMDPSARALMTIIAREPTAALRALGYEAAA